jgi:chromosome partitioning protein
MGRVYTLANQKGGVGKTTTAINLCSCLASRGQRVLLIDLDPQSNATSCLGIDKKNIQGGTYESLIDPPSVSSFILYNSKYKLSVLPSSNSLAGAEVELVSISSRESRLRTALVPMIDRYDYIIVDCPPSLGLLTLNGLVAAKDGVIIPVQCEYLALEGIGLLVQTTNRIRMKLFPELKIRGVLMTMFDGRTKLNQDVVAEVRKYFPDQVFKTIVPRSIRLAEAPSYGQPITFYAPDSVGAKAYDALAEEILAEDGVLQGSIQV